MRHISVIAATLIAANSAAIAAPRQQSHWRGSVADCDGPRLGGHLPAGFVCKGYGTGVAECIKRGDTRVFAYGCRTGTRARILRDRFHQCREEIAAMPEEVDR